MYFRVLVPMIVAGIFSTTSFSYAETTYRPLQTNSVGPVTSPMQIPTARQTPTPIAKVVQPPIVTPVEPPVIEDPEEFTCFSIFLRCYGAAVERCEKANPPPKSPPFDKWQTAIDECARNSADGKQCLKSKQFCDYLSDPKNPEYHNPYEPQPTVTPSPSPTPVISPSPSAGLSCEEEGDKCGRAVFAACYMSNPRGSLSYQEWIDRVGACYEKSPETKQCNEAYKDCVAARGRSGQ